MVIDDDGSPHGPKTFVMWNPPLLKPPGRGKGKKGGRGSNPGSGNDRENPLKGMPLMSRTESRARKQFTK